MIRPWTLLVLSEDKTGSSTAFLPHVGFGLSGSVQGSFSQSFEIGDGFDRYQVTTGSASSIFEHTFSENFKVRRTRATCIPTACIIRCIGPRQPMILRQASQRSVWMSNSIRNSITSDTNALLKFSTGPVDAGLPASITDF